MSKWTKAVVITKTGNPIDVAKVYDVDLGTLPEDKVALKMLMAPVNPSDKLQLMGFYPEIKGIQKFKVQASDGKTKEISGFFAGIEGLGQVTEIGSAPGADQAINGKLSVGDWVVPAKSIGFGTWASTIYASAGALMVIRNREGLTAEQVGTIKINASTSYQLLRDVATVQPGEYIVQNGANSGVGQTIIQLARLMGIKTINIVRDRPNFDELETHLKEIGADIVIKESELGTEVANQLTGSLDAPVKLAINCVGGEPAIKMSDFLSYGGTFVTYGDMSGQPMATTAVHYLFRRLSFVGFSMIEWYDKNSPSQWTKMWDDIFDLFRSGKLREQQMTPLSWSSESTALTNDDIQKLVSSAINSNTKNYFIF